MPRSRSSYTASPMRYHSPVRSPNRRQSSEDGTEYEMDLDALGLNSTFESTGLSSGHEPKLDAVKSDEIEGPEDFTMNMTYWMTAELPLSQIKSRKEASGRVDEVRTEMRDTLDGNQDTAEDGDKPIIEEDSGDRDDQDYDSRSSTKRANETADGYHNGKARSETSMANEEKVMSYLSALPDTDVADALTSTPMRLPKSHALQVPNQAPSKTRSLQATVEDYTDTPRKPTQETVMHHVQEPTTEVNAANDDTPRKHMAELQSRLERQEWASKTRITELETILSFTRSELDTVRTENYKQKEEIAKLGEEGEQIARNQLFANQATRAELKKQEEDLNLRMQEFREELQLQNLAKLQNQRADFERQLRMAEEAKRTSDEQLKQKNKFLAQLQGELDDVRHSKEHELQGLKKTHSDEQQKREQVFNKERTSLNEKLSSLQTRADTLQADLERATAEARTAREEAQANATLHSSSETSNQAFTSKISGLESRIQALQSQLDSSRAHLNMKDQEILRSIQEQERLEQQLCACRGQIEGQETTISSLRQRLADAHREVSKARTDTERFENDLKDATDRLQDARAEADRRVADVEKKLDKMRESKAESETRLKELESEHEDMVEEHEATVHDIRSKAEDAVQKVGAMLEQERAEKKRLLKELKMSKTELEQLQSLAAQKVAEEEESSDDESSAADSKDSEIENLRTLLRKQAGIMKTLKAEAATLRNENETFKGFKTEVAYLRVENETLKAEAEARREDFEAVNKQMDERLAVVLRTVLKERAKTVVGKRDEQWIQNVERLKDEKEFMGRILMREWGRQECGVAEEGEKQAYRYKYVKRS